VLDDAECLDVVARHATQAVFWNMGENCSSNSRLIVHEKIKYRLIEQILAKLRDWPLGDPLDPANRLGAIVSKEQFDMIMGYIKKGKAEGARAVRVANDSAYGLAASIFTANVGRAHRMARDIRADTVTINCYGEGDLSTPFGGFKLSGFGGRDKSLHAHDQYTELKTIWADISDSRSTQTLD
jgi:gamma-glutamyl-gamma-aminobutyraldehyde dehydrogenase